MSSFSSVLAITLPLFRCVSIGGVNNKCASYIGSTTVECPHLSEGELTFWKGKKRCQKPTAWYPADISRAGLHIDTNI